MRVFYLWDFGVREQKDRVFGNSIAWDVPLLDGYDSVFVPNVSSEPGTHRFGGLHNPGLREAVVKWEPSAVMVFGYAWRSHLDFIMRRPRSLPVMVRGDSHLLGGRSLWKSYGPRGLIAKTAIRRCDAALAVGKANADFYCSHGMSREKISFVPHCVDNDRFAEQGSPHAGAMLRAKLGFSSSDKLVIFVGKFERKKRPDLLVDSFGRVDDPDARLLLVGSGPMERELRRSAESDTRIRFLPFQNQTEIPSVYSAADLLVLPSEGTGETWGLVVNEAMNCRCAIIVSSHVGCGKDLVVPDQNGWVFPAGDSSALADCITDALSDPKRLQSYGEVSTLLVQSYSYESATAGLLAAMSDLNSHTRKLSTEERS